MAGSASRSRIPEAGASTTAAPPEIPPKIRHRIKNLPFSVGRRSGAATPLARWKFNEAKAMTLELAVLEGAGERTSGGSAAVFSARKLAAALWHLRAAEVGALGGSGARLGFEPKSRQLHSLNVGSHDRAGLLASTSNEFVLRPTSPSPNITLQKLDALEKATKWDEAHQNHGQLKLFKYQLNSTPAIYSLRAELEQAHYCINKLENEKECAKKKVDHIMKKLAEEKASWQSKEHQKVRNIIESVKYDLGKEKERHRRIEAINSTLVDELAKAKLSANQFLQDCEKERKAREHVEKVCEELAKAIGDDKVEVESLKKESVKICEELEEERRMLQMAEVWREERVQLKLVDAKITLEEKYAELNKLQADLDTFLRIHSGTIADVSVLKETEALRGAVSLVKFNDIEFDCRPPQDIDANKDPMNRYANGTLDGDNDSEDDRLEGMSCGEEQGSCTSPGSDPSAIDIHEERQASVSASSEVYSRTTGQSKKKISSIGKLWRSSFMSNSNSKEAPVESIDRKILDRTMLNSGEVDPSSPSVGMQRSCDSINSCISLGTHELPRTQGSPELQSETKDRRGKKQLLEARKENQRFQLRHVLKK
ncbi:uncharacterized protein LOC141811928 [Curcuma longa]|uniref:uncharacterized protein LOC141811928 n=1 Tax=Curcuma longa TaxID=136217 RepID=UPI003D9F10E0